MAAARNEIVDLPEVIYDVNKKKSYHRGRFLGKGGFARCYELTDTVTKQVYAGKIVNKALLVKTHQREKMAQEISIHRDLKHDYIVDFLSYFEDDSNVYILLELCTKKSLMEMQKRRRNLTEMEVRYFLRQIVLGVLYLHEKKIIHRDLKLGNIFINDDMNLKIGDFGLATTLEFNGERKRTLCGTPNYIAPEVLSKKGHSYEVDIWSIGCIMYTLLVGRPPFETSTLKDTYGKIKKGDFIIPPNKMSTSARNLIKLMLQVDPASRPNSRQILTNEWLTRTYIPKTIPSSCLTMIPRFDSRASFAATGALLKRPLADHNPRSPASPANGEFIAHSLKNIMINPQAPTSNVEDIKIPLVNMRKLMGNLLQQLTAVVNSTSDKNRVTDDDETEDPNSAPLVWISKWVDYSDKYGFGYQLCDDSIGVSFNDLTKMVLLSDAVNFHYINKLEQEAYYSKNSYPGELQKKVKLLNYFQQYMNEHLLKTGANIIGAEHLSMVRLPNMYTWFRTSRAVVMVLTNGTMQINNFIDHSKIILCPCMGAITTFQPGLPTKTYKFSTIEQVGCSETLFNNIKYAMDKVKVMICPGEKEGLSDVRGRILSNTNQQPKRA